MNPVYENSEDNGLISKVDKSDLKMPKICNVPGIYVNDIMS